MDQFPNGTTDGATQSTAEQIAKERDAYRTMLLRTRPLLREQFLSGSADAYSLLIEIGDVLWPPKSGEQW